MSSVDLHTHSGFQRMLPESFAFVCAPKFTPKCEPHCSYHSSLEFSASPTPQACCNVKEALHPHPEVPIYTDKDKGHVQMKDIPLEIVDLR
ncbi:hypothetical protein C8R48DRAFT_736812 [Suillus tomentosus]|nr:hypothetical protein C8R48DRAFT_736812 [Suillus tomentosus]